MQALTKSDNEILVVDHLDWSPSELVEYLNREHTRSERKSLKVYYTGYFPDSYLVELPSIVSIEFLSRGFLPTPIAKLVSRGIGRCTGVAIRIFAYASPSLRRVKLQASFLWNERSQIVKTALYTLISLMQRCLTIAKAVLKFVWKASYKVVKPPLKLFVSVFVEWPLALLMLALTSVPHNENNLNKGAGWKKRYLVMYFSWARPIYERRLSRFTEEFEILKINKSESDE